MLSPPSGGGPGQFTTANGPANTPGGGSRSLNDPASNRPSSGGSGATNGQATSNATTQSANKANTSASNTRTTTLKAVTVCMTSAGSCPMERDVGSACQCKDTQGNVYDGIVK
jgi:hypothetical protein